MDALSSTLTELQDGLEHRRPLCVRRQTLRIVKQQSETALEIEVSVDAPQPVPHEMGRGWRLGGVA
jgi:hypothetical protein